MITSHEQQLISDTKDMLLRIGFTLGECFEPYTGHNLHPKKRKHFAVPVHYYEVNAENGGFEVKINFRRDGCAFYVVSKVIGTSGTPYYQDAVAALERDLLQDLQTRSLYTQLTTP